MGNSEGINRSQTESAEDAEEGRQRYKPRPRGKAGEREKKMKIIEPTKKEIFKQMKMDGCTWCGGHGCECTMKINMKVCIEQAKIFLTRKEYSKEEIEKLQAKSNAIADAFDEFWNYVNS